MNKEILTKLKNIRLFIFDLEGVLLCHDISDEQSLKKFVSDVRLAADEFKKRGLNFSIITARNRDELIYELETVPNCVVVSSTIDKVTSAEKILRELNLQCNNVFFIGDGILDIPLLKKCGLSAAPQTAKREVKRAVDLLINSSNAKGIFNEIFKLLDNVKQVN